MLLIRRMLVVLLCLLPMALLGQNTPADSNDHESMAALAHQIEALQQQAKDLQDKLIALQQSAAASPSAPAPGAEPDPAQVSAADISQAVTEAVHNMHGIKWRGFGEVDYKVLNQKQPELGTYGFVPGSAGNFYNGDFALFLSSQLTNRVSVVSEIVFEETDAQNYKIDLRRGLLNYDVNDHLRTSFGRFQTAIGYYNWAFRSASWLQTTADRPLTMEYASNGGILPTQGIGISATGAIFSSKLGLNYVAQYGSSDTIRPDLTGDEVVTDENNGNYLNVGLFVRPDDVPGLQIGSSYYHDQISNLPAQPTPRFNQTIVNGYLVYINRGIEFIGEGFLIRHSLIGGDSIFNTPAFYCQISKHWGRARPFFRYQYVNANVKNVIFDDVGLRAGPSFGARYELNDYFAFKAQFDRTARRGQPDLSGLHLQLAFTF